MDERAAWSRGALDGVATAGNRGLAGEAGVRLAVRTVPRQAAVLAMRGHADALAEAAGRREVALPMPGRVTVAGDLTTVSTGPGQWLVLAGATAAPDLIEQTFAPLAPGCTLVRLDDSRTVIDMAGAAVRATLAKMLTIDLHPRAFATGHAAVTVAGSTTVTLWQTADEPRYAMAVPRSFARSLWHWLELSGAAYGVRVEGD